MWKLFLICLLLRINKTFAQTDSVIYEKGIASFYAKKFEGRKCSSGEIFRHDSLTAAHKSLKFGTKVKVININNDSSIVVRVNDRLPKNSRRCLDVSLKAAKQLNFIPKGITMVKLEIIPNSVP